MTEAGGKGNAQLHGQEPDQDPVWKRIEGREPFPWRLWSTVFVLTMAAALLIQLVLLPLVFPSWSAGGGLVDNCLDCAQYHRIAAAMAEGIRQNGWSAWELRPEGHAPAGLAAALYAITVSGLWTMVPVNAAVHATTVALLFLILTSFGCTSRSALLGAAPFALFPSSALWYAQLLKDGFFFLGFFLFVRGWISIMQSSGRPRLPRARLLAVVQALSGAFVLWVIRPEMVKLVLGLSSAVCAAGLIMAFVCGRFRTWRRAFLGGFVLALGATTLAVCLDYLPNRTEPPRSVRPPALADTVARGPDSAQAKRTPTGSSRLAAGAVAAALRGFVYLPVRLAAVAIQKRQAYLAEQGASDMDRDVQVETFGNLVAYLPRAVRNAYLSPFPRHWFSQGTHASTTSLRRVCGFEMLVVYFALCCLPFAVWRKRRDVFLWAALLHAGGMLVVLGTIVTNWGTLYRLRYGYLMLWVGIGLAGFLEVADELRQRRSRLNQRPDRSARPA